ncbi:ABC transporter permease [Ketogulonicigenium vulgare]|uniref:Dipeptide transport system permease protein 1 n=1 Tax=Ketogulonicigenium vulgare (strain WSH-001) TaxID=759362 RepID=F9YB44_KETVW|nr:ABC transporter permease [Ketogulonicigenium vulgare]ADO44071.1 oligopeptide ABC transporter permease [Ketogulonicigenium vulgare Y25]AEM42596.1 Dipeptide transport system permease protein 1 [Ketogulonicigenium vulgare WSH-001]ALJ82623.1 peptide ABC transporter permease [Ketogulonicigenium vulgare]ANW35377.1 peptide ABC transporter permease [Ketogulonicigenium vulgare]AOZ53297.1 oligopeptide ABC transporter permease [Ketogulonicigenium vulgare]
MLAYAIRRVLILVPLVFGMAIAAFCLMLFFPGDPVTVLLGEAAPPEQIALMRDSLGLDLPWLQRLGQYLWGVAQGDLGLSIFQRRPVTTIILERLPATVELAVCAMLIAVVLGLVLGVVAALWRGSAIDLGVMLIAQLGISMPVFWLGIMLVYYFSVTLGWLPAISRGPALVPALGQAVTGDPAPLGTALRHLLLPALSLGVGQAAIIARLVRASVLEVIREDFVRTARAKGLSRPRVMVVHVLSNAMLPIISVIGLRFGVLLAGAVLTEQIFGWPGLGQLAISAVSQRDLPLILGLLLTFGLMFAVVNLIVDLLYGLVDPRITLE